MSKLRVLSLFAGIGGFDLGLERTGGFKTVAFCEIDPFCRRVLAKHWPEVPCYHDVRELTGERLRTDDIAIDAIVGGFPCQDISEAGKGLGLAGKRSGLWSEIARLAGELRPQFIVVENVAALLSRGLGTVLGDLAAIGFDAEWHCIPAAAIGAPHRRDRVWIVAYPASKPHSERSDRSAFGGRSRQAEQVGLGRSDVAQSDCARREGQGRELPRGRPVITGSALQSFGQWEVEPCVDRVADGIPDWSHRIRSLGNAVVPQIPELIGRAILASIARMTT